MAKPRNYFALGLWVITVAALFFAALVWIGARQWGQRYHSYVVRYPATFALPDEIKPGAQIHCGSKVVGNVDEVELRRTEQDGTPMLWTRLQVRISRQVELRSDCQIVARGLLLGGGGKLVIKDPGRKGSVLADGAVIDGADAGSVDAALDVINAELNPRNPVGLLATIKAQLDPLDQTGVLGKIHHSLDDLTAITGSVAHQLDATERNVLLGKLHAVLDDVNATTAELRQQMQTGDPRVLLAKVHGVLDSLLGSLAQVSGILEENRPTVRETLLSASRTADTLEHGIVEPVADELNRANTASLLGQLHASFERVNVMLGHLEVVTDKARSVAVLNEERVNHLLRNLSETAEHLKSAGKDLRRNPWRLFYRPSLEETRQLNIFDAAREFSEAAARLDESAAELSALMESYGGQIPGDDPNLARIRQRLQETFDHYTEAEQALWKQLDVE